MNDKIELLSESLIDVHKELTLDILGTTTKLCMGLGWHYILDIIWILKEINLPRGSVVLDAGGGMGVLQFILAAKGYRVVSVDVNQRRVPDATKNLFNVSLAGTEEEIKHSYLEWHEWSQGVANDSQLKKNTSNTLPQVTFYHADLKSMPLVEDRSFDAIVSLSALEHNEPEDLRGVLCELQRVLKKDGQMLLTVSAAKESFFHKESHSWVLNERELMNMYGLAATCDSNFLQYDDIFESICAPKYLQKWLNNVYYKSEKNGMPWGMWQPQYTPVGIVKNNQ